ncbi:hypothetical protein [Vibrio aestuarianus]|uniref:Uncharacterized protein n=1 Tax=Vibrio aestuarianus TaxID=28171 RepID=A0ABM9FJ31_9VIBR|nr:hypothetical protein [Vibrio aestuarianus]MDE1210968.1 hypothetical protein [Vibrio aestuarianus]MDE1214809.1 hypothetical protein [Vibrio aestuarianus]MDE1219252.1 hypothetical protein [Vibrio aestuarianus]MDE1253362.1 hypothetical protein [Vibrio aestuarianus]MDE1258675.1 hypothetical protein [Vibrio aestuarianus]
MTASLNILFSFHCLPSSSMLEISQSKAFAINHPVIKTSMSLQNRLNAITSFDLIKISKEVQQFWAMGLYQQLAKEGLLHQIFPNVKHTLHQKLSRYLSHSPSEERFKLKFWLNTKCLYEDDNQPTTNINVIVSYFKLHTFLY